MLRVWVRFRVFFAVAHGEEPLTARPACYIHCNQNPWISMRLHRCESVVFAAVIPLNTYFRLSYFLDCVSDFLSGTVEGDQTLTPYIHVHT